jgi:hypothetical protein
MILSRRKTSLKKILRIKKKEIRKKRKKKRRRRSRTRRIIKKMVAGVNLEIKNPMKSQ